MSTYQQADKEIYDLAEEILSEFPTHKPIVDAGVKIDIVVAYGTQDENGEIMSNALNHHGNKALGICRILKLKDRAMGRGDAEISLDGDWWRTADIYEQRALLDHELHHIAIKGDEPETDDLGRPKLRLRKHDTDIGWFGIVAERHGEHSMERKQAKQIADAYGQFYWPEVFGTGTSVTVALPKRKRAA